MKKQNLTNLTDSEIIQRLNELHEEMFSRDTCDLSPCRNEQYELLGQEALERNLKLEYLKKHYESNKRLI